MGKKPALTPYEDREDTLIKKGDGYTAGNTDSYVSVKETPLGIKIDLEGKNELVSEYGINLPFNFMGKKNGGGWENQFLFNSPYPFIFIVLFFISIFVVLHNSSFHVTFFISTHSNISFV